MRTVVLVRHARSLANARSELAGRSPGVDLDETGRRQADELVTRLADVPLAAVVSSPLDRCRQTLAPLLAARHLQLELDEQLSEVDYGSWTGRKIAELAGEPLWRTVQAHPSAAQFPDGEAMAAMAARAVAAVRRNLAVVSASDVEGALLICSHGDVIKAVLADALGLHLDQFQRISVGPASVSVVRYTEHRPFVERLGDTGSLTGVVVIPAPAGAGSDTEVGAGSEAQSAGSSSDAVVGGGTGAPPDADG